MRNFTWVATKVTHTELLLNVQDEVAKKNGKSPDLFIHWSVFYVVYMYPIIISNKIRKFNDQ